VAILRALRSEKDVPWQTRATERLTHGKEAQGISPESQHTVVGDKVRPRTETGAHVVDSSGLIAEVGPERDAFKEKKEAGARKQDARKLIRRLNARG